MIHVAAFSGGKDSTALLLWLREQGIPLTAVFCDTGWEHQGPSRCRTLPTRSSDIATARALLRPADGERA